MQYSLNDENSCSETDHKILIWKDYIKLVLA